MVDVNQTLRQGRRGALAAHAGALRSTLRARALVEQHNRQRAHAARLTSLMNASDETASRLRGELKKGVLNHQFKILTDE